MASKNKNKSGKKKQSKSGGVTHHHITRVLYVALVAFAITTGLVIAIYSGVMPAQAAANQAPSNQTQTFFYNASALAPSPVPQACPAYFFVYDAASSRITAVALPSCANQAGTGYSAVQGFFKYPSAISG